MTLPWLYLWEPRERPFTIQEHQTDLNLLDYSRVIKSAALALGAWQIFSSMTEGNLPSLYRIALCGIAWKCADCAQRRTYQNIISYVMQQHSFR